MMMMKLFTLLSLVSVAFGQDPDPAICQFALKMYSSNALNDCFEGWPMKQAENMAWPLLKSWQEKEYPQLIDESDECTSVVTLKLAEYNSKTNDEKDAYQKSQEHCGWNIGYDRTYAFFKDAGYRKGWDMEYTNKIDPNTLNSDYVPIGEPSLSIPIDPSPKPEELTYEQPLHWYATEYAKGWNEGEDEGMHDGEEEGKKAGKLAREVSDDYHFAYASGYKKGYNDGTLELSAMHDEGSRNRQLRSVERKMREQYSNGYSDGYDEAMQAKEDREQRELFSVERNLVSQCTQDCRVTAGSIITPTEWRWCKQMLPSCYGGGRRMQELDWTHVATLPMDGVNGGEDFKNLIAHVIANKCQVQDVTFEVWKVCPSSSTS